MPDHEEIFRQVSNGRSKYQGFRVGKLLSDSRDSSVTLRFLQTLKIYGVVNNDLISFSVLVIYFKIYILVYFSSVKYMFRTAMYSEGLNNISPGSPRRGPTQSS